MRCGLAEGNSSVIGERDEVLSRPDLLRDGLRSPGQLLSQTIERIICSPAIDNHDRHHVRRGLHGKGTESENADHTVSTLRGTVSR